MKGRERCASAFHAQPFERGRAAPFGSVPFISRAGTDRPRSDDRPDTGSPVRSVSSGICRCTSVTRKAVTEREIALPVERKYRSNAERQAAYRERHPEKRPPTEVELATLARSLHVVFAEAVEVGESPLPHDLIGDRADQTLRNLIRFLDRRRDRFRSEGPSTG